MYNFIVRLLSLLIFNKTARKQFRNNYLKKSKYEILKEEIDGFQKSIKKHIDQRFFQYINSFHQPSDVISNNMNLKIIQKANNILLREFKRICEQNEIEYWLDWGTLLGAVRHGGFIPWDDDVDVSMTRENLIKLNEVMKNEKNFILTEWLHLKHPTDKCRVKKFCFNIPNIKCYVDIFAYDYCNTSDKDIFYQELRRNKILLQKELTDLNMPHYNCCSCTDVNDMKKIDTVFNKYINMYAGNKDGNTLVYGIESPYNVSNKILDKSTIFPLQTIKFNNVDYSAPNDIREFLSVCYGNYMMLPIDMGLSKHFPYSKNELKDIMNILKSYEEIK